MQISVLYFSIAFPDSFITSVEIWFYYFAHLMVKKVEKHLVIVESPAKSATIKKYLGENYEVKASY